MSTVEDDYPCLGVCMIDADGYCTGCGRPSLPEPAVTHVDEAGGSGHQPPAEPDSVTAAD